MENNLRYYFENAVRESSRDYIKSLERSAEEWKDLYETQKVAADEWKMLYHDLKHLYLKDSE